MVKTQTIWHTINTQEISAIIRPVIIVPHFFLSTVAFNKDVKGTNYVFQFYGIRKTNLYAILIFIHLKSVEVLFSPITLEIFTVSSAEETKSHYGKSSKNMAFGQTVL